VTFDRTRVRFVWPYRAPLLIGQNCLVCMSGDCPRIQANVRRVPVGGLLVKVIGEQLVKLTLRSQWKAQPNSWGQIEGVLSGINRLEQASTCDAIAPDVRELIDPSSWWQLGRIPSCSSFQGRVRSDRCMWPRLA